MDESFLKMLNKLFKEYNNKFYIVPEIQEYKLITDDKVARCFNQNDLYNKKYILYLNRNYIDIQQQYLRSTLFHELTHLYDSTILSKYDFKKYLYIMQIYSEVHASEIEMDSLLENIQNINIYSMVNYYNITIYQFLKYHLNDINNEFILPDGPIIKGQLKFNHKKLYYFIGYLRSLQKYDIQYEFEYSDRIPLNLKNIFNEITDYYLNNNIVDYDILYNYQDKILYLTKDIIKTHMNQFI